MHESKGATDVGIVKPSGNCQDNLNLLKVASQEVMKNDALFYYFC